MHVADTSVILESSFRYVDAAPVKLEAALSETDSGAGLYWKILTLF